jgi:hypothetical protein
VFTVNQVMRSVIGVALSVAAGQAQAQSNLDASKSPAEIFSDTCGLCHESARALKPSNAAFLRKHYTTGPKQAATMAAFLEAVASEPPPPAPTQARRPSDSIEQGTLGTEPESGATVSALARPSADGMPLSSQSAADEFEE